MAIGVSHYRAVAPELGSGRSDHFGAQSHRLDEGPLDIIHLKGVGGLAALDRPRPDER